MIVYHIAIGSVVSRTLATWNFSICHYYLKLRIYRIRSGHIAQGYKAPNGVACLITASESGLALLNNQWTWSVWHCHKSTPAGTWTRDRTIGPSQATQSSLIGVVFIGCVIPSHRRVGGGAVTNTSMHRYNINWLVCCEGCQTALGTELQEPGTKGGPGHPSDHCRLAEEDQDHWPNKNRWGGIFKRSRTSSGSPCRRRSGSSTQQKPVRRDF